MRVFYNVYTISMASILDEYELTVERFEGAIAVGRYPRQILLMFNKTSAEMDEWCKEHYKGHDFKTAYEWVRMCTVEQYLQCVHDLGLRGNPSALGIIDKAIQRDDSMNTVKIVFSGGMPTENDEDKLDDDCESDS